MFEGDDNIFPNKPEVVMKDNRSSWVKTILSMLLFVAVFVLLFSEDIALILMITGILLLHELGHFFMMKRFGYRSLNMLFIPIFGAMVSGDKVQVSQKQKFWISIMGPLPGILLGMVGMIYCLEANELGLLFELSLLLLSINLLNLFPIDPLDGGHIVEALFFPSSPRFKLYFTLFSSLALIALGFFLQIYIIMIFGFFMSLKVRGIQKNQKIHENLDEINVDYKKPYQELSNREYWTIRRIFLENNPKIKEIIPDDLSLWENEKLIVDQVRQLLKIEIIKDLKKFQQILLFLLFAAAIIVPSVLLYLNLDVIIETYWSVE
ncbi:MAG: site-2 protease family protein [Crocinitomicaceae bacterium]|nr:site-2 protease family protein [Crocinitomicaceae bacterium]